MAAPAAPSATSIVATSAQLLTFITAHGADGVYLYTDVGQVPAGAGVTGANLLAAIEANATVIAAVQAQPAVVAAIEAADHVFPTFVSFKAKTKYKTNVYDTATITGPVNAILAEDTTIYVKAQTVPTFDRLWYVIADGAYVGDYVDSDDLVFLPGR